MNFLEMHKVLFIFLYLVIPVLLITANTLPGRRTTKWDSTAAINFVLSSRNDDLNSLSGAREVTEREIGRKRGNWSEGERGSGEKSITGHDWCGVDINHQLQQEWMNANGTKRTERDVSRSWTQFCVREIDSWAHSWRFRAVLLAIHPRKNFL